MLDPIGIQRARDNLRDHLNNVLRMMEGIDSDDRNYTQAVIERTTNAALNEAEQLVSDLRVIKSAYWMKVGERDPRAWPRVPRYRDQDLPKVASAGGL